MGQQYPPESRPPGIFGRISRSVVAASGITIAVLYGWWQSIDEARVTPALPEAKMGEPLNLGRVVLTPLSFQQRPDPSPEAGSKQLVLTARVENVTGETQFSPLGMPVRLVTLNTDHGVDASLSAPQVMLLRDHQPLMQLQPRMPEDVEIIWPMVSKETARVVLMTFHRQQFKLKDNLYGRSNWLGYLAAAQMNVTAAIIPSPPETSH